MTPDPPDDDKCQVSMCQQAHFTYCPHCKLFVCIEHLNQHYSNYKQEYQSLLNDGKQQQILNKQFLDDIEEEKKKLISIFDREVQYYELNDKYFREKSIQVTVRPQDCADLRLHILQSSQKRLKFKKFIHQIQQLINDYDYHQPNGIIDDTSSPFVTVKSEQIVSRPKIAKSSPLAQFSIDYEEIDDDEEDDNNNNNIEKQQQEQPNKTNHSLNNGTQNLNIPNSKDAKTVKITKKNTAISSTQQTSDESLQSDEDSEEEAETDNDNHTSDPDFGSKHRSVSTTGPRKKQSSSSKPAANHFQVNICPLRNKIYGIDLNTQPLRHVPCTRDNISSIYLFTHLRVFHCLTSRASLRIVRHIMFNGCESDCDLFSQTKESLVNILPKSYRGRCPLTKLGAFGLNKYHDIRLCDESQTNENTGLLNHLVVFHCLSYPWANKLCNAVQASGPDGSKQVLFKPNEPIKAKKWLTAQGKSILAKRYSTVQKRKKLNKKQKK